MRCSKQASRQEAGWLSDARARLRCGEVWCGVVWCNVMERMMSESI